MTPAWLLDVVAALMLVVAAVSAARLAAARPWQRGGTGTGTDTDVAHLLMAIAMAGMLAPGVRTLPDAAWEIVFGLLAAWFAVRVARDARANGVRALASGHCAPHLVHSCSMLYMFLAMTVGTGPGGMAAPGMAHGSGSMMRYPTLALLFAFVLVGYSVWDLDQLSGRRYSLAPVRVSLAGVAAPAVPVPGLPVPGLPLVEAVESTVLARPDSRLLDGSVPLARPEATTAPGAGTVGCGTFSNDGPTESRAFLLSPAVTIGCRIAMGVAMAFMLFIAI